MKKSNLSVVLFHSANYSLWAFDELKERSIECEMISVPRHLSSDCGYSIQFNSAEKKNVELILKESNIDFDQIVEL